METWMLGAIVAIYLTIMAFVVAHKDGSARSLGLVSPVVAIGAMTWYLDAGLDWPGFVVAAVALALFAIGLSRPNDRDDVWHYLALAVAWLGELILWLLVVAGTQSVTVPVLLIIIVVAIILIAALAWLSRRKRRSALPAPSH